MIEQPITTILLAGGRRLLREGIGLILAGSSPLRVVGDASDLDQACALVSALQPDVLLLSAGTELDAPAAIARLREKHPQVRIIVLLPSSGPYEIRTLFAAGAAGCLSRECASEELLSAVRVVTRGEHYVSPRLKQALLDAVLNEGVSPLRGSSLSSRERSILCRIASGRSTKEIAAEFTIGVKTVETHRRRIMNKLNRRSIAELTQYALLHGLLDAAFADKSAASATSCAAGPASKSAVA